MSGTQPRLAVLIVSYRRADLLRRCLDSVARQLPGHEVLVWDNRSSASEEIAKLAKHYPNVRWHFCAHNKGYAAAVNALAAMVDEHDLLLLNPDAELRGPLTQSRRLLGSAEQRGVAAVSPQVLDHRRRQRGEQGHRTQTVLRSLVSAAGYAPRLAGTPVSDLYRRPPVEVSGYLTGCALLLSRAAWREIGEFDERFFLYAEEAQWQRRARATGWRLLLAPEPDVCHSAGGTADGDPLAVQRSQDLLRAGQTLLLGLRGNRGPGARYSLGRHVLDRLQRSHRAGRARTVRALAAHADPARPAIVLTSNELCHGGAERQRVLLAGELVERGYPVTLVCLQAFGPLLPELDPRVRLVLTPWWQPLVDLPERDAILITGITNTEAGFAWGWRGIGAVSGAGSRRWLAASHEPALQDAPTYGRALTAALRASDGVITLSTRHREMLNRHGSLHRRGFVAPNGVPAQPVAGFSPGGVLRLGMLCRMVEHKNPVLLMEALAGLTQYPWTLDLFGDGPDAERMRARTPAAIADRVRWRGAVAGPDDALAELDVLCVPSRAEAFPLVIVEAMTRGVPVMASATGSVGEMLDDGAAGLLVEPITVSAWREAMARVLAEPRALASVATAGATRAQRQYSVSAMADAYEQAIEAVRGRPVMGEDKWR